MTNPEAQQSLEQYVYTRLAWIGDAVEIVSSDRNVDPLVVFKEPMPDSQDTRASAEPLELDEDQEQRFREIAGRFGIGGELDVVSDANYQILEGGKPWKVESELAIATNAQNIIFAAQTVRKIGEDESTYMANKFGADLVGASEYDMARKIAESQPGFEPLDQDEMLPFGYEVSVEHEFKNETTGQLIRIGTINGKPVMMLRLDAEIQWDESKGKEVPRFRPDGESQMSFISQVLETSGDTTSSIGLNTSTTYAARAIDVVRAGVNTSGRLFLAGMYGRSTIARIQGKETPEPSEIQNFPGELRAAYKKLIQLRQELTANE